MKNFKTRMLFHILGLLVMTFGIAVSTKGGVGVASVSTISFAGSKLTPLTFGMCSSLFQAVCFLSQIAITRRFTAWSLLQIPMVYIFGALLDFFSSLLRFMATNVVFGCLLVIIGTLIFSLGLRIILGADFALPPTDGLVKTISDKVGWPISKSKLIFDITVVSTSAVLTTVFLGNPFVAVGVGTVITMVLTGPIIGFYYKIFPFFDVAKDSSEPGTP
ncbi:MAG: DUF6198 family protein [Peptococcaceae bacterium]|nr:DUF6198 family protein [Peptococcaceae bacterium]